MNEWIRKLSWRLGRKLYCWARGDMANDPTRNGEYWLIKQLINGSAGSGVLFDVGANVGDWSCRALDIAKTANKEFNLIAFEPCSATRDLLQSRLPANASVEVCAMALSSLEGEADFFSKGAGVGTNSLSAISGSVAERVQLTTLDKFMERRNIERVAMLKIDTEGFDLNVLRGAGLALASGRIDLVQFEYNWRWLLNKASLFEVFRLIEDKPYRLGKLVGNSIVFYDKWHFELDRYFENNYVLVLKISDLEHLGRVSVFDLSNVSSFVDRAH